MRLSVLRPLNRAVKYQASVQSSDATGLAACCAFQTDAYNLSNFPI